MRQIFALFFLVPPMAADEFPPGWSRTEVVSAERELPGAAAGSVLPENRAVGGAPRAQLPMLANSANFSGTGRDAKFTCTVACTFTVIYIGGGEHPEPAAVDRALLGHGDALEFARRVERLLANAAIGCFLV
jgi:hypothetical protein